MYATWPYDKVTKNGKTVGISTWVGYSSNEGKMLTLAILDNEHAQNGNEVTFVWGEQPGTGSKPNVESHVQVDIRATVCPVPYAEVVREVYRSNANKHEVVAPPERWARASGTSVPDLA